jgi:type VI secretion system secreted protein Hcp
LPSAWLGFLEEESMAIYMKYGSIEGDVTQAGYKKWIAITSFQWQVTWAVTTRASVKQDGTRNGLHPQLGDITIIKDSDNASADLLTEVCTSNIPKCCTIRFVRTTNHSDPDRQHYQEYIFYNCLITDITTHATGDEKQERPAETIKINFTAVEMKIYSLTEANIRVKVPQQFGRYDKIEAGAAAPAGRH